MSQGVIYPVPHRTLGGLRVGETETHYVDVLVMAFNWRVAEVPKACAMTVSRHWCYAGLGKHSWLRAVSQAMAWLATDDAEPEGWNKNGQTGEWRAPEPEHAEAV